MYNRWQTIYVNSLNWSSLDVRQRVRGEGSKGRSRNRFCTVTFAFFEVEPFRDRLSNLRLLNRREAEQPDDFYHGLQGCSVKIKNSDKKFSWQRRKKVERLNIGGSSIRLFHPRCWLSLTLPLADWSDYDISNRLWQGTDTYTSERFL